MSRWIDADALINDLEHDIAIDEDILAYVGTDQITRTTTQFDKDCKQNAIDLLIHAPSIDIVRCKECKSYIDFIGEQFINAPTLCGRLSTLDNYVAVKADDFCSRGERRE